VSQQKIKIVRNCVSQQVVDFLEQQLLSTNLQWVYSPNVTDGTSLEIRPGFSNNPFSNEVVHNTAYWFLYPMLLETANKNNFFVERLLRIRIGAYVNRNNSFHNNIHVDNKDPHIVGLYYPHNSDGDTVFFDCLEKKKEILRISPEKGSMVFFDGSIPHASSNPTQHDIRITVNFNFVGKWPE